MKVKEGNIDENLQNKWFFKERNIIWQARAVHLFIYLLKGYILYF